MFFGFLGGVSISIGISFYFYKSYIADHTFLNGNISSEQLAIITSGILISLIFNTVKQYKKNKKRKWPYSQGRIQDVLVEDSLLGKRIKITYSYRVEDREYENNIFDFSQEMAKPYQIKIHPELRKFKSIEGLKGKLVKVYYDKKEPWNSAISRRVEDKQYITAIPSLVVIIFCFYSLFRLFVIIVDKNLL